MKHQFKIYREATNKTGNAPVKPLPHFNALYAIFGERPLDRPITLSFGLSSEDSQEQVERSPDSAVTLDRVEEQTSSDGGQINIPDHSVRSQKRRRLRLYLHGEQMESHYIKLLNEVKEQGDKLLRNQELMLEAYKG